MLQKELNHYAVLGAHPHTTVEELRLLHGKLATQCHPDKVAGMEHEFHLVSRAYNVLKNARSRADWLARLRALAAQCGWCSGRGTDAVRTKWAHATLIPCPRCNGCGLAGVPKPRGKLWPK